MSTDLAMEKPGPMGWGLPDSTLSEKMIAESKGHERLMQLVPQRMMRGAAREPVKRVYDKIKSEMALDGMEDGFNCCYIESVIYKDWLTWLPQLIGSCVASGSLRAAAWRMMIETFLIGDPEEIFGTENVGVNNIAPFGPFHYRGGRKIAGFNGGRPNGRDDGSNCKPQIEAFMRYGFLPCAAAGLESDAFPEPQSESLYRKWGADDTLFNKFTAQAKPFILLESETIHEADQGKTALVEGFKPFMICSDWAFKPLEAHPTWRLRDGAKVWIYVRDRSQTWSHNMTVVAFVLVGGKWYVIIVNSWGNAHKNGTWFVIPIEEFARWLREAECASIGDIDMTNNAPPFPDA